MQEFHVLIIGAGKIFVIFLFAPMLTMGRNMWPCSWTGIEKGESFGSPGCISKVMNHAGRYQVYYIRARLGSQLLQQDS